MDEPAGQERERKSRFSHSRLSSLEQCPRAYSYRYVERIVEAFQSVEAFCGSLVHEALAWLYTEREARRSAEAPALVERFRESWRSRLDGRVKVVRDGKTAEDHLREGERLLRAHHATTFVRDRRETLAVEPRIDVDLGGHAFTGFIDRLARDAEGRLHVIDFKTGRAPRSFEEAGLQLHGYGLAVLEQHGGVEVMLELDYLRGSLLTATMTRAEVPVIAATLGRKIAAALLAEEAGAFPARPSKLCAWCGYRERCDVSGFGPTAAVSAAGDATVQVRQAPPEAAQDAEPGGCPDCGRRLTLRSGRRGAFMGCTGFPSCRFARDLLAQERGAP